MKVGGLHHITAMASSPQRNLEFYTEVLGLRLVKRTVNFDDPGTYHFYFGDPTGRPGSLLTFFPWPLARRGAMGSGETTTVTLAVAQGSLGGWLDRLDRHQVEREAPRQRFGREGVRLRDPDGLILELVEGVAERGPHLAGVTLQVRDLDPTSEMLASAPFDLSLIEEGKDRRRFESATGEAIDLVAVPLVERGRLGAGSVHHVAWRAADAAAQLALRSALLGRGLSVTPVQDRRYFESIYFREPGGVLFEIATDGPGFHRDEARADLGRALKLPPWLESERRRIEEMLPEVDFAEGGASEDS